jgi:hypothetical protein
MDLHTNLPLLLWKFIDVKLRQTWTEPITTRLKIKGAREVGDDKKNGGSLETCSTKPPVLDVHAALNVEIQGSSGDSTMSIQEALFFKKEKVQSLRNTPFASCV